MFAQPDQVIGKDVEFFVGMVEPEDRGLLWVYMHSGSALYGVVTLESTGHCDPRVIGSGALFRATLADWLGPLGLEADRERLLALMDEELAR